MMTTFWLTSRPVCLSQSNLSYIRLSLYSPHKARLLLFTASISNTFAATHLAIVVRRLSLWPVKGESESFDQRIGREEQRLGREVFELFIPGDERRATVENPAEVELLRSV